MNTETTDFELSLRYRTGILALDIIGCNTMNGEENNTIGDCDVN